MKRYLPLIIIVGVLAVALGAGMTLWRSSKQDTSNAQTFTQQPTPVTSQTTAPNQIPVSQPGQGPVAAMHERGGPTAKVMVEEYGDYQCPPCGMLFHDLKTIEKEYGTQIRFVFRHFPLQGHKHAVTAAHAAEAAGLQDRFWEMHDMIYQNQLSWSPADDARPVFVQYARDLKLDVDRFNRDMDSPVVAQRVASDYQRGLTVGVNGTPTIFINGRQMNPNATTLDGMRGALDFMLGKKK
ncbi:MAG TPA: thioredoxin domain-containing protein [Pyrinomonadaceae bacterium]|nr:thioredoxin domain-containing protein [Pyrinomonadaceae bacterium]